MELLQLRYFIKLAQRQHLTQTAEELMISASSLSATIRKLEKELNVELFERKGRNIRLSASGKIFYKYISQAQALFDTAVTEAQRSRQSQTLLIFVENTHIWAGAFLDFKNKFTNIQLNITPLVDFGQLIEPFDFYLGNVYNVTDNKFKYHILFKPEKYYVLMSSGHRLAKRESVSLNDLKDETFFQYYKKANPRKYQHSLTIFQDNGVNQPKILESDEILRYDLIRAQKCVFITTNVGLGANFSRLEGLTAVPFTSLVREPRTQVIAWNKAIELTNIRRTFYTFIVNAALSLEKKFHIDSFKPLVFPNSSS